MLINPIILAQIGVAWVFIRYLRQHDVGHKEPTKALVLAGVLGGLATVAALFLESWLLPDKLINDPTALPTPQLLNSSFLVGVIEESVKSLPIAIFLYKKKYFDEVSDGIIYFAIAGMMFGLIEDIGYDLSFGSATGIARILTGPFIHAGFCALFGFMLARQKVLKAGWLYVVMGLIAAMGLHGIYDFGLFYHHTWTVLVSLAITAIINFGVFLLYKYAKRIDARLGLSAVGVNYYCRSCGRPNSQRFLYCPYCGNKT